MKKNLFMLGLTLVSAMALLTNCSKNELEANPVEEGQEIIQNGIPFKLTLNAIEAKTTNDGMDTNWATGDAVNVFHAESGSTTYVNDGKFTLKDAETGVFEGTLASELDAEKSYDWYVIYPYLSYITTPANTSAGFHTVAPISSQTQTGNDSKAHLAELPLAGKTTTAAGISNPAISMYQLSSVVKVIVTNNSGADLPVSSVKITTVADTDLAGHEAIYISGNYYIDFTDPAAPVYTAASSKSTAVTLNTSYLIPNSETGTFYIAVKPFSVLVGDALKVKVNNYEKNLTITGAAKDFPAGEINKINFNYNEAASVATLNFSIDGTGGYEAYSSTTGVSSNGVTSNYADSHSPYLAKFDNTGDYVQIRFNEAAEKASIGVKKIGGNGNSSFVVKGSADGASFTEIETLSVTGSANDIITLETSAPINASYRYIRFEFTRSSNVGVGPISIIKHSNDPQIIASNIEDVPAIGASTTASYTIKNFAGSDDVSVKAVDGSVVTSASVSSAGTISYTVAPNYTTSPVKGAITLTSTVEGIDKTITVSQLAETFSTSAGATVIIPKDASSTEITITTPTFGWNTTVTPVGGLNLSLSPASGSANASAQSITISSNDDAADTETTLGTITIYRNGNTTDPQKKTITVKKAASAITYESYSTGFESNEGFTAGTDYQSTVTVGAKGKQWKIFYGTPSTSSKIAGSQSLAMRLYNNSTNYGYAEMQFDVPGATKVSFKAKAATTNNAAIKLTIKESKDGGTNWTTVNDWSARSLTSSAADYSFTVSGTPEKYRIRFEIDSSSTKPTSKNAQLTIDDVTISVD